MTNSRNILRALALSYILIMSIGPSLGISVSCGTNGVSSSANYHLDASTSLTDVYALGDSTISRTSYVSGSEDNELSYQTSADTYNINTEVKSSGTLHVTTSTTASSGTAVLSQNVAGNGDLTAVISGSSGSVTADQGSGVENGILSTSQSLTTDSDIVVADQDTQMTGDFGSVSSTALGQENLMVVAGEGAINGAISADLQSIASTQSYMTGAISDIDNVILSKADLRDLSSADNEGLSISHLYCIDNLGATSFDANAVNLKASVVLAATSSPYIPPDKDTMTTGGAYRFTGHKWAYVDGYNPKISLLVDTSNRGTGISGTDFGTAIYNAAMAWDSVCPKQLFGSIQSVNGDLILVRNNRNQVGWYNLGTGTTLAATKVWNPYGTVISGSNSRLNPTQWASEADIAFNSNSKYTWTNQPRSSSSNPIDAQAVAAHELGHLLGLHHTTYDRGEIMFGSYPTLTGRSLGTGDKAGIKLLYA